MNNRDLQLAEQRFLDLTFGGRPPGWFVDGRHVPLHPFNLDELPEDRPWDDWRDSSVDQPGPAHFEGQELAISEYERRSMLVGYARQLIESARADEAYEKSLTRSRELPAELETKRLELASRLRAYEAHAALGRLTPRHRRRAALLIVRCPDGCMLASIYRRRPQDPDSADETLLLVAHDRKGWLNPCWISDATARPGTPASLPVGCKHDAGRIPTSYQPTVRPDEHASMTITDVPGASWRSGAEPWT